MCHVSAEKTVSKTNPRCGCGRSCPVIIPVEEECRCQEDHKKILQDQLEVIDKKITVAKSVNPS